MRLKFQTLIIIYTLLTGCKNELRVIILEPLKPEVVKIYTDKDSAFAGYYNEIRMLVDSVYLRDDNKSLIQGLTYATLYDFKSEYKNRFEDLKNNVDLENDWKKSFGKTYEQFIVDSTKFRDYIKRNSYKSYVKLEFIKAYEKERWIGKESVAEVKVTPLNGNVIRSIVGNLIFKPKGERFQEGIDLSLGNAFFSERYPHTKSFVVEAGAYPNSELLDYLNLPKSIIDQKYDTYFALSELIIEDRFVDVSLDSIPTSFKMIMQSPNIYNIDFYIKEELDPNYNSISDLIRNRILIDIKKKYAEEVDFYNYGYEKLIRTY